MGKLEYDIDAYPFIVRPLPPEDGCGFMVEYPDVPYIIGDGDTVEAAMRCGRENLEIGLRALTETGKPIPPPHSTNPEREGVSLNTMVTTLIAEGMGRREGKR